MENEEQMQPEKQSNPLSGLDAVLQNPELLEKLKAILSSTIHSTEKEEITTDIAEEKPEILPPKSSETLTGDGLLHILDHPQMMEKLPQMMALMKPFVSAQLNKSDNPSNQNHSPEQDRNNLLFSLKPFLSPGRQSAVDNILQISKLGKVLKDLT